jgi:hypothetical protein
LREPMAGRTNGSDVGRTGDVNHHSQLDGILAVTPIFRHTASTCGCVSSYFPLKNPRH